MLGMTSESRIGRVELARCISSSTAGHAFRALDSARARHVGLEGLHNWVRVSTAGNGGMTISDYGALVEQVSALRALSPVANEEGQTPPRWALVLCARSSRIVKRGVQQPLCLSHDEAQVAQAPTVTLCSHVFEAAEHDLLSAARVSGAEAAAMVGAGAFVSCMVGGGERQLFRCVVSASAVLDCGSDNRAFVVVDYGSGCDDGDRFDLVAVDSAEFFPHSLFTEVWHTPARTTHRAASHFLGEWGMHAPAFSLPHSSLTAHSRDVPAQR
jgi:hypothetical protein